MKTKLNWPSHGGSILKMVIGKCGNGFVMILSRLVPFGYSWFTTEDTSVWKEAGELFNELTRQARSLWYSEEMYYKAVVQLEATAASEGPDAFVAAMGTRLKHGLSDKAVKVLLYVDEAHELATKRVSVWQEYPGNRLSAQQGETLSALTVFTRVFHFLSSSRPLFLSMMSTNSIIRNNGTDVPRFHEPYTELPFDCLLGDQPIFKRGAMTLAEVAAPSFLTKFGRPLSVFIFMCTPMG